MFYVPINITQWESLIDERNAFMGWTTSGHYITDMDVPIIDPASGAIIGMRKIGYKLEPLSRIPLVPSLFLPHIGKSIWNIGITALGRLADVKEPEKLQKYKMEFVIGFRRPGGAGAPAPIPVPGVPGGPGGGPLPGFNYMGFDDPMVRDSFYNTYGSLPGLDNGSYRTRVIDRLVHGYKSGTTDRKANFTLSGKHGSDRFASMYI